MDHLFLAKNEKRSMQVRGCFCGPLFGPKTVQGDFKSGPNPRSVTSVTIVTEVKLLYILQRLR